MSKEYYLKCLFALKREIPQKIHSITLALQVVKKRENKNLNNKENHGVINSTSKKEIIIVGDSMIKNANGPEVSKGNSVNIRCHPGATTDVIIDYVRPTARKKPDMIIIHTGTNDIQNNVNTLQKVRKVNTTFKFTGS